MEPFKNSISPDLVRLIAQHLAQHLSGVEPEAFANPILEKLPKLELKERSQALADALHSALPPDFAERNRILLAMLHPDPIGTPGRSSNHEGLCGWGIWPLTMVVGQHGLEDFDNSLATLKEMTKRSTAEFDVRPFLVADQPRALTIIEGWVHNENLHVRRLASEGTRPRLPWGIQLKSLVADPKPALPILEALRDDPEEYVRRSVANHLNDIAKDHPDLVARIAQDWMRDAPPARQKLVRHACRTLIKQGHAGALKAFGVSAPQITEPLLSIATPVVEYGDALEFSVALKSIGQERQNIILDYELHFKKANGSLAPKVFKWTKMELAPGQEVSLSRRHAIRPITTRKYYDGAHALSLRINGERFGHVSFELQGVAAQSKG